MDQAPTAKLTFQQAKIMAEQVSQFMTENKLSECLCCEASLNKSEHTLTKGMVVALEKFAEACLAQRMREANPKRVIELNRDRLELDERSNWTKLRFFGLVAKYKVNGVHKDGMWVVTRNGWAFLRGEIRVPKYIRTFRNHIVEKSTQTVSMAEVYGSQPYFPLRSDFFHQVIDGEDLNIVKESRFKKKRREVKTCPHCRRSSLKKSMTVQLVDNIARPTYWLGCSLCGFRTQTENS